MTIVPKNLKCLVFIVAVCLSVKTSGQTIASDERIDGARSVFTSKISIDKKYSKTPVYVEGNVFFGLTRTVYTLYFSFKFPKPLVLTEDDIATVVVEGDEVVRSNYIGDIRAAGLSRTGGYDYFGVEVWESGMKTLSEKKAHGVRIKTKFIKENIDFDISEKEADSLIKLIKLMLSIKN